MPDEDKQEQPDQPEDFELEDPTIDNFDPPTREINRESMEEVVYGEGEAPIGPDRPTKDLHPFHIIDSN